jgi:hypothetical protein
MVEVEAGIISPGVMADPLAVVVDVGRFRVTFLIAEGRPRCAFLTRCGFMLWGSGRSATRWGRAVFRNVAPANGMAAGLMIVVLPKGGKGQHERHSKQCWERSH